VTRLSSSCLAFLICLPTIASADLKIKTRTTVMGHSSESTVYIKGSRERSEMSFGGHGGMVNILQCDQKRMISIAGDQCTVMALGGTESTCPAAPNLRAMARGMDEGESAPPRKGGVVTITRTSTDTGERQDMFGYKARHIRSSMTMASSPDACNQSNMKMEMDGWYADLANFSCADESYRAMACGGMGGKRGCTDRIVMKGGGGAAMGFPLKQTMTITSGQGTFTTTTEVVELTNATLEASLFEAPPGCKATDMSAMSAEAPTRTTASEPAVAPKPAGATASAQPAAAPEPPVAAKAAGVVRIGVVALKDASGQGLPTDSLQLNLLSEFARHQFEAIPLTAEAPLKEVESEARSKQCDYFVYTVPTQVKDPGTGGVSPALKGVTLDPAKYQALTVVTLYKVGKPLPELKDLRLAADASQFAVDAVTATFVQEGDRVAQQIADDAHPKAATKTMKAAPKQHPATANPK